VKSATQSAIATLFVICASNTYAGGRGNEYSCIPVDGTVTTTNVGCGDSDAYTTAYNTLCPAGGNNCLPSPLLPPPQSPCFKVAGKGKAKIDGDKSLSVLTSVVVANQAVPPMVATTPLGFPPPPYNLDNVRSDLSVFTSRASLNGKLTTGQKGTLYTEDTGVITIPPTPTPPEAPQPARGAPQIVGQILKIVGGTGDFDKAYGTIAVAGTEVGGAAFYTGEVCVKRKR
jgi:hypothetical protein